MSDLRDANLMQGFLDEARAYLPLMEASLASLRDDAANDDARGELRRLAHNLRGAGTVVGLTEVAEIAGSIEEVCEQLAEGAMEFDGSLAELVMQGLEQMQESLMAAEPAPAAPEPPPVRKAAAKTATRDLAPEDIPPDLLEGLLQEADEHLQVIGRKLSELEREGARKTSLQEIRRSVHTIKGAAGMVGLGPLSRIAHRMEDLLDSLYDGIHPFHAGHLRLLYDTYDIVTDIVAAKGASAPFTKRLMEVEARYNSAIAEPAAGETPAEAEIPEFTPALAEQTADTEEPAESTGDAEQAAPQAGEPSVAAEATAETSRFVRAPLERLDDLTKLVSESFVQRSAFEQQLSQYRREIAELTLSLHRLRRISSQLETEHALFFPGIRIASRAPGGWLPSGGANPAEFDSLEMDRYTQLHLLSRDLSEAVSDVGSAGTQLEHLAASFDGYINRQSRLTSELQDKLMRLRMVPLATLANRLARTVRVTAQKRGKQAELQIVAAGTELDKAVIERLAGPLEHLLRNAVDHGVEPAEARLAAGKSASGKIVLTASHEGTEVILRLEDDGGGIDLAKVRREAVNQGIYTEQEAASLSEAQVLDVIFQPGFTTAEEVSDISGRGVGMDIVKSTVEDLKGTIEVSTRAGAGTSFLIRLPMSMAVTRVLMVSAHHELFALPLSAVGESLAVQPNQIDTVGNTTVLRLGRRILPVVRLGEALSLRGAAAPDGDRKPAVVIRLGAQEFALEVDRIFEAREVVVKPLGRMLKRIPAVAGATILGDGRVVLILNPADLVNRTPRRAPAARRATAQFKNRSLNILIVDDSLSVRRVVANLVRNAGWNPVQAKDGMEAIEILGRSDRNPDAILMDIEMPRMDGFELTAWLRSRPSYQGTPILMLTSRAAEKHRAKAMALGVTEYLVKPFHDEVLLNAIRRRVEESRRAA